MNNPKPLDLEEWIKELKEKAKKLEKEINDGWKIEKSGFFISIPTPKRFIECKEKDWEVARLYGMMKAIKEIKQEIKKRCEFYLRYKDNPSLLWKENPKYRKKLKKFGITEKWVSEDCDELYDWEDYNEWLFKLAFKSVLE